MLQPNWRNAISQSPYYRQDVSQDIFGTGARIVADQKLIASGEVLVYADMPDNQARIFALYYWLYPKRITNVSGKPLGPLFEQLEHKPLVYIGDPELFEENRSFIKEGYSAKKVHEVGGEVFMIVSQQ